MPVYCRSWCGKNCDTGENSFVCKSGGNSSFLEHIVLESFSSSFCALEKGKQKAEDFWRIWNGA